MHHFIGLWAPVFLEEIFLNTSILVSVYMVGWNFQIVNYNIVLMIYD